jgi:glyoxylase-like metal-dependent hydrolase (beta-lactamase superfamily II)
MNTFKPVIHRYQANTMNLFVNVFLVETKNNVVAIDSALCVSSCREIRTLIEEKIRKPLVALLLTHGHPDHYTGAGEITKGWDVKIVSTQQAYEQMKSRDKLEGPGMAAVFKEEYPDTRVFSNTIVKNGEILTFDDVTFTIEDLGPCESDNDSIWKMRIDNVDHIFTGDLIYNKMHSFIRDVHFNEWQAKLDLLMKRYDHTTVFHNGHGEDCGIEMIPWQKAYLNTVLAILKSMLQGKDHLSEEEVAVFVSTMKSFLPNDDLVFFLIFEIDKTIALMKERNLI